jgi:hypothetical protein
MDRIERFLSELAEDLELLGPIEAKEVLAEVRSHLLDALIETGGDELAVLARFGPAGDLSERILEERGLLTAKPRVPDVSVWRRLVGVFTDLVMWYFAASLLSVPFVVAFNWKNPVHPAWLVLASVYLAAEIAGTGWWLLGPWFRCSSVTTGMRVVGVQPVGVSEQTRLVRVADIPGTRAWGVDRLMLEAGDVALRQYEYRVGILFPEGGLQNGQPYPYYRWLIQSAKPLG